MTKRQWAAGWNMPGYMPEAEPAAFDSWAEAAQYIIGELRLEADRQAEADNESEADAAESLWKSLQDGAPPNRAWSGNAGAFAWWIQLAE